MAIVAETVDGMILTPKSAAVPAIHSPSHIGVRPNSPVLYRIPATGDRPMSFSVTNLPLGLVLNSNTGIISGSISAKGEYKMELGAKNALGNSTRSFSIVVGNKLALTPPMGWNSWNCFAGTVSKEKVLSAATALVQSGLADHGWQYINTDDYWSVKPGSKDPTLEGPERSPEGAILPNPRFVDIKSMVDHIHSMGLKAGIYSSPGPLTCAGCIGSYQHEKQDAQQFAAWGFDYLKYDWCSYHTSIAHVKTRAEFTKPYRIMGDALAEQNRDILFSLCEYGKGDVWEWGASVGGACWRTGDDIEDTWASLSKIGFNEDRSAPYAGPGHWNDPDMLTVGKVGWGADLHATRLTSDEQYTQISLWCLLSAPLLIGCDLTQLDPFTFSLLTNDEVIAIDQDALGKQAVRVGGAGQHQIYAKTLEDGSLAVGLFNLSPTKDSVSVDWKTLKISGPQTVRDLWRQKDLGAFPDHFTASVSSHGVVMIRLSPAHS